MPSLVLCVVLQSCCLELLGFHVIFSEIRGGLGNFLDPALITDLHWPILLALHALIHGNLGGLLYCI